jgi:pimeloyl-ACP methyl ester carboxylesterase
MPGATKTIALSLSLTAATAGVLALGNHLLRRKAERDHPATGDFVRVAGSRLHYVKHGQGPDLVLLHGNGSMIADFESSGLIKRCGESFRVITFDRPGYGHSPRRGKALAPHEQADIIAQALSQVGVKEAILLGHSWGTLVALQLALRHPTMVKGLVLASGYYFPTARADVPFVSIGAVPVIGAILCHTVLPLLNRLIFPGFVRTLFAPAPVPAKFKGFPPGLALRPSQLRSSCEEAALMIPSTVGLADSCRKLSIPVSIVCGAGDQLVDPRQSARLAESLPQASLQTLLFNGHMVHHTSMRQLENAILEIARRVSNDPGQWSARA